MISNRFMEAIFVAAFILSIYVSIATLCCQEGLYGLDKTGCKPCNCYAAGSINSNACNRSTGQCECKQGFRSRTCDQCDVTHYQDLNASSSLVCLACNCHVKMSLLDGIKLSNEQVLTKECLGDQERSFCALNADLKRHCDLVTGQCPCSTKSTGRSCNQCAPRHIFASSSSKPEDGQELTCQACDSCVNSLLDLLGEIREDFNYANKTLESKRMSGELNSKLNALEETLGEHSRGFEASGKMVDQALATIRQNHILGSDSRNLSENCIRLIDRLEREATLMASTIEAGEDRKFRRTLVSLEGIMSILTSLEAKLKEQLELIANVSAFDPPDSSNCFKTKFDDDDDGFREVIVSGEKIKQAEKLIGDQREIGHQLGKAMSDLQERVELIDKALRGEYATLAANHNPAARLWSNHVDQAFSLASNEVATSLNLGSSTTSIRRQTHTDDSHYPSELIEPAAVDRLNHLANELARSFVRSRSTFLRIVKLRRKIQLERESESIKELKFKLQESAESLAIASSKFNLSSRVLLANFEQLRIGHNSNAVADEMKRSFSENGETGSPTSSATLRHLTKELSAKTFELAKWAADEMKAEVKQIVEKSSPLPDRVGHTNATKSFQKCWPNIIQLIDELSTEATRMESLKKYLELIDPNEANNIEIARLSRAASNETATTTTTDRQLKSDNILRGIELRLAAAKNIVANLSSKLERDKQRADALGAQVRIFKERRQQRRRAQAIEERQALLNMATSRGNSSEEEIQRYSLLVSNLAERLSKRRAELGDKAQAKETASTRELDHFQLLLDYLSSSNDDDAAGSARLERPLVSYPVSPVKLATKKLDELRGRKLGDLDYERIARLTSRLSGGVDMRQSIEKLLQKIDYTRLMLSQVSLSRSFGGGSSAGHSNDGRINQCVKLMLPAELVSERCSTTPVSSISFVLKPGDKDDGIILFIGTSTTRRGEQGGRAARVAKGFDTPAARSRPELAKFWSAAKGEQTAADTRYMTSQITQVAVADDAKRLDGIGAGSNSESSMEIKSWKARGLVRLRRNAAAAVVVHSSRRLNPLFVVRSSLPEATNEWAAAAAAAGQSSLVVGREASALADLTPANLLRSHKRDGSETPLALGKRWQTNEGGRANRIYSAGDEKVELAPQVDVEANGKGEEEEEAGVGRAAFKSSKIRQKPKHQQQQLDATLSATNEQCKFSAEFGEYLAVELRQKRLVVVQCLGSSSSDPKLQSTREELLVDGERLTIGHSYRVGIVRLDTLLRLTVESSHSVSSVSRKLPATAALGPHTVLNLDANKSEIFVGGLPARLIISGINRSSGSCTNSDSHDHGDCCLEVLCSDSLLGNEGGRFASTRRDACSAGHLVGQPGNQTTAGSKQQSSSSSHREHHKLAEQVNIDLAQAANRSDSNSSNNDNKLASRLEASSCCASFWGQVDELRFNDQELSLWNNRAN